MHRDCIGSVAEKAAVYSDKLCYVMISGTKEQFEKDGHAGMIDAEYRDEEEQRSMPDPPGTIASGKYKDDTGG